MHFPVCTAAAHRHRFELIETRKGSKLEKTWLGPYVVTHVTSKGVATMETKDGKPPRTKHNINNLKKYKTRERDGDLNNHCV